MSEESASITCAVCGSTHTNVREVNARERTMWVDCQDCQQLSSQPYPLLRESANDDSHEDSER